MTRLVLARPSLKYTAATTSVTLDGNSIPNGSYATGGRSQVISTISNQPPISTQYSINDVAISGQTFALMQADHSDVDAAFATGKTNVLIAWEVINSVWDGQTGFQAYTALLSYLTAVRAVHPWKVVVVTGTYRWQAPVNGSSPFTTRQCNQEIDNCNAFIVAGAGANQYTVADIRRAGSPFNFDPSTVTGFINAPYAPLDGTDSNGTIYVHHNDTGFNYTCGAVIPQALARVPR